MRTFFLPRPVVRWGYALAAALAISVIAVTVFRLTDSEADLLVYRAAEGQTQIINLPDGSTVRLVDGSELSHNDDVDAFDRQVSLSGKAYFDVQSDDVRFNVTTRNAVVSVFGTSFGVTSEQHGALTEVVLVSGSVQLRSLEDASASVMLEPGQASRVLGTGAPLEPSAVNVDRALSWTDLFIFRETQLREVAGRLSESFDVRIIVSDDIEKRTVTGTFSREQGLRPILDAVATALNLSVLELPESGGYRLTP